MFNVCDRFKFDFVLGFRFGESNQEPTHAIYSPGVRWSTHRGGNHNPSTASLSDRIEITRSQQQWIYTRVYKIEIELLSRRFLCEIGKSPPGWYYEPCTAFVTPSILTLTTWAKSLLCISLVLCNSISFSLFSW